MDRRQRYVATREARLRVARPEPIRPRSEPDHDEGRVRQPEHRLGRLVEPALRAETPEEQDDRPLGREARRRADQIRSFRGHRASLLAVRQHGHRPNRPPSLRDPFGDRRVHRDDGVGALRPPPLASAMPREEWPAETRVAVRLEDDVDDVVDDPPRPTVRSGSGAEPQRDGDGQDPASVVEVGRGQLPSQRQPPSTDVDRPEKALDGELDEATRIARSRPAGRP